jgi:hypothetical protein
LPGGCSARPESPVFGFPAGSCGTPAIWFFLNFYWWSKGWSLIDKAPDGKFFMNITPDQIAEGFD